MVDLPVLEPPVVDLPVLDPPVVDLPVVEPPVVEPVETPAWRCVSAQHPFGDQRLR